MRIISMNYIIYREGEQILVEKDFDPDFCTKYDVRVCLSMVDWWI